jgi:hypothetical protein
LCCHEGQDALKDWKAMLTLLSQEKRNEERPKEGPTFGIEVQKQGKFASTDCRGTSDVNKHDAKLSNLINEFGKGEGKEKKEERKTDGR